MKPEELQIGDWVWYNPNVFNEDEYELPKECYPTKIESGEDIDLAIEECYEPISITPEILLGNGFMKSRQGDWFFVIENKENETLAIISHFPSYRLEIESWDDLIGSFESGGIKYIHQLQQAMRLCGITKEIKI